MHCTAQLRNVLGHDGLIRPTVPELTAVPRGKLSYDGTLFTDDAAMAPYRARLATDATIRGGDLVLAP